MKQSGHAKLALNKGHFNARLQSTGVYLMANCLSKLKRKEQMIRYKKVLKAPTKARFTNIISADGELSVRGSFNVVKARDSRDMNNGHKRALLFSKSLTGSGGSGTTEAESATAAERNALSGTGSFWASRSEKDRRALAVVGRGRAGAGRSRSVLLRSRDLSGPGA